MSFRNRLTFFFVVIVIVPMIAVAIVLFRLISDNETGKADAGVAARAESATRIYGQDSGGPAAAAAAAVARDAALGQALASAHMSRAGRRARQLVRQGVAVRIVVLRRGAGALDAGDPHGVAPVVRDLVDAHGRRLGRLEVSVTPAAAYASQVKRIVGVDVIVHHGLAVLASTLPGVSPADLPAPRRTKQITTGGTRYRAVSVPTIGFTGAPLQVTVLSNFAQVASNIRGSRLVAAGFIVVFFVIAFGFAILVSRSLQRQIAGFLDAARRLGSGDFSTAIPIAGQDEFAALGDQFNKMSRQLEERLAQLRDQQARLEESLRRVGETFASKLDRDALLEILLRTAVEGVGAEAGRATVRDGADELRERAHVGDVHHHELALAAVERSVLQTGSPSSEQHDGAFALGHPLAGAPGGGPVAALLSVARGGRPFHESERELFYYLAGQAAVSLENVDLHEQAQLQAVTDELTGLYNHRRFYEAMAAEIERSRRFGQQMGLVMLDIDNFKQINDAYGHQQGDLVLREVARLVRENSREIDAPARYGGEELAVVLPGTDLDGAYNLAERVRTQIDQLEIRRLDGVGRLRVTASFGVAAEVPDASTEPADLIAAADNALYRAKRAGKNKSVRAE